jgi:dipeptidyl aminopeptidase/acylaminoacyl peptidase
MFLTYIGRSMRTLPNAFVVQFNRDGKADGPVRQITRVRVSVAIPATEDTILTYRITANQWGAGVLTRPAGATGPLPTIVQAYPDQPSVFHRRNYPGLLFWGDAFAAIARGYAVLLVDVPLEPYPSYGPEGPAAGIVQGMTAAINAFAHTGWIDTTRIGVTGQSYGGYMVNVLITKSDLFSAAVSVASISDLVSGSAGGMSYGPTWFKTNQGRMETLLADAPERYVLNSPVPYLDRVRAPLLLVHGVRDNIVHISQSEEMFRGLSTNNKPVELVRYHREGHSGDFFLRAAWTRGLNWFDEYLKD